MPHNSTTADLNETGNRSTTHKLGSRLALTALLLIVLCGAVGVFGVHTSTARASGNGYTLAFDYPRTARAGLDVTWRITVQHVGGFDGPITIAITADQFDIYETQGFAPEPSGETRDAETLYLTFDPPPAGDTFTVSYDAYIQPSSQIGRHGTVAVLDHGETAVSVNFDTWLAP